jgi:tetratricopeptide (TPR) repeat protein
LFALLTSINTLSNGYASDDAHQVVGNAFVKSVANLPYAFTTSVWSFATDDIVFAVDSYYRPLFNILFTVNYALYGTTAWGWHLTSVLVHTLATSLVFLVIKELASDGRLALVTAGLFAVHPAHAESVAWVSGITDPLMTLFLLPAFYYYLRHRKTGRSYLIVAALGCYFLALLSKETALTLTLVVAYCELFYFKDGAPFKQRLRRMLALAGLFIVPTAVYFLMRYAALSRPLGSEALYPLGSALATMPLLTAKYLALLFIPSGYSYQHLTPFVDSIFTIRFLGPAALIAVAAAAVLWTRSRLVKLAAAWFVITLAPALYAIRQFDPEYLVQERYLYVPSMGFCLVVALAIEWVASRRVFASRGLFVGAAASAALAILWGAVYIRQNSVWRDDVTVFKNCVAADPTSPQARVALARSYYGAGRPVEAEAEARSAISLNPNTPDAYMSLSYFAHRSGRLDSAVKHLEEAASAVEAAPLSYKKLGTIYLNLGLVHWQRKDITRAEENLLRSLDVWPRPVARYHTGNFYFDQGRFEDARAMYERCLEELPRWFAPIHLKLGQVYERLGQPARAKVAYERYIEVTPATVEDRNEVMRRLQKL